ncbi:S8 family serine peptidase, partial [candidate division TA06 bacterium]|nr:S8 family serine peptidase [candidate division TA06 bacterium]
DTISNSIGFSLFPKLSVGDTTYIVWQDDEVNPDVPDIFLSFIPFMTPVNVSSDPSSSYTPDVVKGGNDWIHVVWTDQDSMILYKRSQDPGSWTGPVQVLSGVLVGDQVNPAIAAKDSFVHVVWEFTENLPSISSAVYYRRSTGYGGSGTWEDTVRLANDGRSPLLEVDGNGTLHLIFRDVPGLDSINIGYLRSTDQGASWDTLNSVLDSGEVYIEEISLAVMDTILYVVWKQGERILFASSPDGINWSTPDTLSNSVWDRNPLIATDGSDLYTIWTRRGDGDVSYDPSTIDFLYYTPFDGDQDGHGTWMLSIIAGLSQFNLIGPAFGSDFLLAKTERGSNYEYPIEEDWWVDGLEWVTSQGAEIVSSSIAYTTWGVGDWYDYSDMDGKTAVSSRAASLALKKGVLLVNAMSNPTDSILPEQSIAAPPDAFDILAVGGVDNFGNWFSPATPSVCVPAANPSYSAKGPPADGGRKKPELVAPFEQRFATPNTEDINEYFCSWGTSGATALVAGLAAVVKSAHPSWTAEKLRDVLMATANNASSPNDTIGWGIPDAIKAIGDPDPMVPPYGQDQLLDPYPNPFRPNIHISGCVLPYRLLDNALSFPEMRIYTLAGELVREFDIEGKMPGRYETSADGAPVWYGKNEEGNEVASGLYICVLSTGSRIERKKIAVVR